MIPSRLNQRQNLKEKSNYIIFGGEINWKLLEYLIEFWGKKKKKLQILNVFVINDFCYSENLPKRRKNVPFLFWTKTKFQVISVGGAERPQVRWNIPGSNHFSFELDTWNHKDLKHPENTFHVLTKKFSLTWRHSQKRAGLKTTKVHGLTWSL